TAPLSSVQGLITGFNSRELVDAIIAQARVPADRMEANIVALQQKTTALTTYRGLLDTVRTAARTLRTGAAFDATTATTTVLSGSRALANVTTTPSAAPGSFTLTVNTLARAEKLAGTGQADFATALGVAGTFSVNGQDVVVTTADSLVAIRDRINALNSGATPTGVSATILSVSGTDHRLILTSDATGAAGIALAESSGTALQALGFLDGGGAKLAGAILTSGADASFSIDGIAMTRTSNVITDAITGVTLSLVSEEAGASTAIAVGRFGNAAEAAMQQFVDAYNALVTFIQEQGTVTSSRPALYGDSVLRTARAALPAVLLEAVGGAAADLATVARAGLSLDRNGKLSLDAAAFNASFTTRYSDLRTLFTEQFGTSSVDLTVVSSGANAVGGTFGVEITVPATRASIASTVFNGVYDDGGTPDTLTVTDTRSGQSVDVILVTGMTSAQVAAAVQAAFDAAGLGVTAVTNGNQVELMATEYGALAGIQVAVAGTGDGASELFSAPASAFGTDVAGTIGGEAATGNGRVLVGNPGTAAAGISVLHTGTIAGMIGDVTVTVGAGARIERLLDPYLSVGDGMLATKQAQMEAQANRLQSRILTIDAQLERRREVLLRNFLQMEAAVARLQRQSNSLLGLTAQNQDQ
ncbi:MAG: flagellar filament capping protein FliD, partial [Gemmatimonadales bacterium]|nr:flagellar filament capping protein FliD [Gemmatimonadales bacterium]